MCIYILRVVGLGSGFAAYPKPIRFGGYVSKWVVIDGIALQASLWPSVVRTKY